MRFVSALILLAAVRVHSFGVNGKALRQPTKTSGPFASDLPFPSPTALQQQRWDRDYRDNAPVGEYRTARYGNRNSITGPPSIYHEAPQSTEAGWWNEEKKNYRTSENRLDRRVYTSGQYNNNNIDNNYMPVSNVNSQRYDVTPEEWKQNSAGGYDSIGNSNRRSRRILRADDRGRAYEYNGMPPPPLPQYDPQYNDNYPGPYSNDYNYGFGGQRGEVVGTYNDDKNYDPNDVTPAEWQDSKRRRRQDGGIIPGPGREMRQDGYNGPMNYDNNVNFNNGLGYRQNYNGNFNDNGLYDPAQGQGSWWNQESKDYSTNMGRQETRAFGRGPVSSNRNGVTPDEWNDYNGYNRQDGRFGVRPIGYKESVQGPNPVVRSWWDNLKNGFSPSNSYNNRYGNNYNYNGGGYNNRGRSPRYNNNNRNGFVNVGYNNRNQYNYDSTYQRSNYVNYDYENQLYYNNNNGNYQRYDNYYDEYRRPEYVTTDRGWWKEDNRNYSNRW